MRPPAQPFLGAESSAPADADAIIVGFAADGGVSFRPGAKEAPDGIRRFSDSIETYSPRSGLDLDDYVICDLGTHDGPPASAEAVINSLLQDAWSGEGMPLLCSLGGDHSVTPPIVRAVARQCQGLSVVGFDAHLDMREDYPGDHACTYRRISDAGVPCYVYGVRSGARSEWEDVPKVLKECVPEMYMSIGASEQITGPVYVTIDIDVLDPSVAPGTGNPEPGGRTFNELLEALESLEALDVVGFDVVEVSPPLDPSGITQAAAAVLVREMILRFGRRA